MKIEIILFFILGIVLLFFILRAITKRQLEKKIKNIYLDPDYSPEKTGRMKKTFARWSIKIHATCPYCRIQQNIKEDIKNQINLDKSTTFEDAKIIIACAICQQLFIIKQLYD